MKRMSGSETGITGSIQTGSAQSASAGWAAWFVRGYDRRSFVVLGGVVVLYSAVGLSYRNLIDPSKGMDWLLAGIWVLMTGLLVWRIDLRRDVPLALVALVGGTVIEWWGTNTNLWFYFTLERPPIWILPAWPVAAMTVDRLVRIALRIAPDLPRLGPAYWVVVPAFVVLMTHFLWGTVDVFASQVVIGLMVGVALVGARPRRDIVLFIVGASLGIFLEYWGTTRYC